ncbi:MAG: PEP-CTERM sorting domain-containing protein [Planctomycetaceae bacterium]|jgi:hypothetical protein|nr:PEP-CTERM sorting domain-containing protein [Planctomycetaceae bacterium]
MKFQLRLKEVGLMTILIGLSNVAFADLSTTSQGQSIVFSAGSSGSSSYLSGSGNAAVNDGGISMTFDVSKAGDDQASLGTCAMNPTSGSSNFESILDEIPMEEAEADTPFTTFAANALAADNTPNSPSNNDDGNNYYPPSRLPPIIDPPPINPTTPEPATLLIIGLSVAGFAPLVKRYRRK